MLLLPGEQLAYLRSMPDDITEPSLRLPVETWDEIIAFNHNDHQTLANCCSLVCRAWTPTCRVHHFHELTIMPAQKAGHRPSAASLLCDLFSPTCTSWFWLKIFLAYSEIHCIHLT